MKKQPAIGQQRLSAPVKLDFGKPLGVRKLTDIRPGWKPDIVAQGDHYRRIEPSKEVNVSSHDRMFLECFGYDKAVDGEEIWNRYFKRMGCEIGPVTFHKWVGRLVDCGLITIVTIRRDT